MHSISSSVLFMWISLFANEAIADVPPIAARIEPAKVTVSSHLPPWKGFTFDATNLHDGRVDTSWQPAKSDMLGVGQWVEIDLGAYYAIDRVEIAQGLQLMHPKLGDLFCRNNRMSAGILVFDDGSTTDINAYGGELVIDTDAFYGYAQNESAIYNRPTQTVARKVLLIIKGVFQAVDWTDVAIAEIRVFGRPADPYPTPLVDLRCNRPGTFEFKAAVFDYCSRLNRKQFGDARCSYILSSLADCTTQSGPGGMAPTGRLAMPSANDIAKGTVTIEMRINRGHHRFRLVRSHEGRWVVKEHLHTDEAGNAVPSGIVPYAPYFGDSAKDNPCWDRLKKKRPSFNLGAPTGQSGGRHEEADMNTIDDDTDSVPPAEHKNARP